MIFQRALRRELASAAGATFTVLFTIISTWVLISVLGKAAGGRVDSADVVALIAFAVMNYLPTILILTSFISVVVVITRSYRDSEMVVWFASGQSLVRWIRPVLAFGLPIVALTAALAFFAVPWARGKSNEYIQRFENREDLKKVAPGQFKESSSSDRVFFVEGVSGASTVVQNVFVNTVESDGNTIVVAKEGVIEQDKRGGQYLVLKNGRRYHGVPGQADFQSMEFDRYSMRVATKGPVLGEEPPVDSLTNAALIAANTPFTMSEVLHRVAAPITCLVLMLLAIPLGFVNPRAGSATNLILAVLIFFTYNNLVRMTEVSIKQDKVSFGMAWWPLPLVAGLCVVGLFVWRGNPNHQYHPRVLWSRFKRTHLARLGAAK